jgi:glycine cleavage system aminomethyltransferase T
MASVMSQIFLPNTRLSPYHAATQAAGATEYMVYNHMYMPLDYGRPPAEDYRALREAVTLWDVGAERQVQIQGPDAVAFANHLVTRDISDLPSGHCRYVLVSDEGGRVICDPVLLRPFDDTIWLSHGSVDLLLWVKAIGLHTDHDVRVTEADVSPLQLQGPNSRDVLHRLIGDSVDGLAYYDCMAAVIAGHDVILSRTGWSGELGYEIFPVGAPGATRIWDAIVRAGEPSGLVVTGPNVAHAIECGITDCQYYTNFEVNALEFSPRLVDLEKPAFIGRDALRAVAAAGARRRTIGLLGGPERLPRLQWAWTVHRDGSEVGRLRWAAFSPALERMLAIALIDTEHADPGIVVSVHHHAGAVEMETTTLPFIPRTA